LRRGQSGDTASGQDKGDEEAGLHADWQEFERKFKNDSLSIEVFDKLDD